MINSNKILVGRVKAKADGFKEGQRQKKEAEARKLEVYKYALKEVDRLKREAQAGYDA